MSETPASEPTVAADTPAAGVGGGFFARLGVLRFRLLVGGLVVAMMALVVYAAVQPSNARPAPPVISTSSLPATATGGPGAVLIDPPEQTALAQAIAYLEDKYLVSLGVAIAPIAPPGEATMRPWQAGSLFTGLTWETLDIAVALAVLNEPKQPEDPEYLLWRALHESSPAGWVALWQFLGVDADAAAKTRAVLAASGDHATEIPFVPAEPGNPPYGQTRWALADQAAFVGSMYCSVTGQRALEHMTHLHRDHTFGLALLPSAAVKSGFGVELSGATSVRQVAVISPPGGVPYAVSVHAVAIDGKLETAKGVLNELAPAILAFTSGIEGHC